MESNQLWQITYLPNINLGMRYVQLYYKERCCRIISGQEIYRKIKKIFHTTHPGSNGLTNKKLKLSLCETELEVKRNASKTDASPSVAEGLYVAQEI